MLVEGAADRRRRSSVDSRMSTDAKPKAGLEDVVAGESAICYLDGDRGVLAYQGYDIHDLANAERGASFEEVCYLLWHGRLPNRAELGDLQTQLAAARMLPEPILRAMKIAAAGRRHGRAADADVDARALRSATRRRRRPQANYRKAVRLTGQLGSLVATWGRHGRRRRTDRSGSGARPRRELPLHAHGPAAVGARGARVRRVARAARRSRAERVDVRGARRRGHAHRHPLGDRRRHRRAEGAAARRRQRRGDEDAARDRHGRRAGTRRGVRPRASWRARKRSPASATASTAPRIRARRTCAASRRRSARRPASRSGSRCRSASKRS